MHGKHGHTRRTTAAATANVDDPFGPDGFGDTWDNTNGTDSDSDEDFLWQYFHCDTSIEASDWKPLPASRIEQERSRQQAEAKRREEYVKKERAAAAVFNAHKLKKKAAIEAARKAVELTVAKETKDAKNRWQHDVERAYEVLAFAKPIEALLILFSLLTDESFMDTIENEERENVAQMYQALSIHHELQSTLCVFDKEESQRADNSSIDESTIGGDTVEANRYSYLLGENEVDRGTETGDATVVVDRLSSSVASTREQDHCKLSLVERY